MFGSNSYEKETIIKYLGSSFTNKNSIKEIKCILKVGNLSPNTFVFSTFLEEF